MCILNALKSRKALKKKIKWAELKLNCGEHDYRKLINSNKILPNQPSITKLLNAKNDSFTEM